jgi:hypothetical protein
MPRMIALALAAALGAGALSLPAGARLAAAAEVAVSPADTTVDIGNTVTLRIVAGPFSDLKAYQLRFGFDPGVLQFTGVTAGDVLTGGAGAYSVAIVPDVTAPTDTAQVDCAQLTGVTSGPGVLIYYHFLAVGAGDSPIACDGVDFRNHLNEQTLPACTAGAVHVVNPTPARPVSWGRVKTSYR